jgi:hypothetical protein
LFESHRKPILLSIAAHAKPEEGNIIDQYKWLHPDYISPPMAYDDGPLRNLLLDPEGVSEPLNAGAPYAEY